MSVNDPPNETGFPPTPSHFGLPAWYPELLDSVAGRISVGRRRATAAVNRELITTYWAIGRDILDRQEHEGYGSRVIDRLSADLKQRFPEARGYSPRNLKYMRKFGEAWPDQEVVQGTLAQLPWWSQIALMEQLQDPDQRLWYAARAIKAGWNRDILAMQIDLKLHERKDHAITDVATTTPPVDSDMAQQATRDPYVLDFLDLTEWSRERELGSGLVEHVCDFLLELGTGFAFVGAQVQLEVDGEPIFCDLLFYHLRLRAYVVIDIKAATFEPAFLGPLGMYMAAVDVLLAHPDDKATIGLMLCRNKNHVVAEYALRGYQAPIGAVTWAAAIHDGLPEELRSSLPSIEELEAELSDPRTGHTSTGHATTD